MTQSKDGPAADARLVRTREALRQALLRLIERKQLDDITIREITAEAGVGYATFFRHYASKAELLDVVAATEIQQLLSLATPLLQVTGAQQACLGLVQFVQEHRNLWSALLTGGAAGTLRQQFIHQAMQVAPHVESGNTWLPIELGAVFGVSATVEILTWWLRHPDQLSVTQVAEILHRLVVDPAVGPRSRS